MHTCRPTGCLLAASVHVALLWLSLQRGRLQNAHLNPRKRFLENRDPPKHKVTPDTLTLEQAPTCETGIVVFRDACPSPRMQGQASLQTAEGVDGSVAMQETRGGAGCRERGRGGGGDGGSPEKQADNSRPQLQFGKKEAAFLPATPAWFHQPGGMKVL